jgi:hypothetical protein
MNQHSSETKEIELDSSLLEDLADYLQLGLKQLQLTGDEPPTDIVMAVDECVYQHQKGQPHPFTSRDDGRSALASVWGQQLVRALGWHWAGIVHPEFEEGDFAIALLSENRSLLIYPVDFIEVCWRTKRDVTIALAFNMLVKGDEFSSEPPNSFCDVMAEVRRIIPRDLPR